MSDNAPDRPRFELIAWNEAGDTMWMIIVRHNEGEDLDGRRGWYGVPEMNRALGPPPDRPPPEETPT
jgi:hypothetical protein